MCQFGSSDKIIDELVLSEADVLLGLRNRKFINPFKSDKRVKAINNDYIYPIDLAKGNPTRDNSEGIYAYLNYNYNNYYNNYYYNNICGTIKAFGKIFKYKEGFRAEFAKVDSLVILTDKRWFGDKTQKFAEHFNQSVNELAQIYGVKTISQEKFESL